MTKVIVACIIGESAIVGLFLAGQTNYLFIIAFLAIFLLTMRSTPSADEDAIE